MALIEESTNFLQMRKEWEVAHTVTEELVEGPPSRRQMLHSQLALKEITCGASVGSFSVRMGRAVS